MCSNLNPEMTKSQLEKVTQWIPSPSGFRLGPALQENGGGGGSGGGGALLSQISPESLVMSLSSDSRVMILFFNMQVYRYHVASHPFSVRVASKEISIQND